MDVDAGSVKSRSALLVVLCTMGSHNFKAAANCVLRLLQRMSRDIRCNILYCTGNIT